MPEDEIKRAWEKIRNNAETFKAEIIKFPLVISGVIAATGKDTLKTDRLKTLKEELEKVEIHVSEYEPFGSIERNIVIKIPDYFSLEYGGKQEFNMKRTGSIFSGTVHIILIIEDFGDKIIEEEREDMPGEPSSSKHDGLAKNLLIAMHDFKIAILEYANEVY